MRRNRQGIWRRHREGSSIKKTGAYLGRWSNPLTITDLLRDLRTTRMWNIAPSLLLNAFRHVHAYAVQLQLWISSLCKECPLLPFPRLLLPTLLVRCNSKHFGKEIWRTSGYFCFLFKIKTYMRSLNKATWITQVTEFAQAWELHSLL